MERPSDPIAAVTHPDPYPYYADLVGQRVHRDAALGLWIAASAADVTAVLGSDRCRVRPPAEPIPRALLGSPAGDIFGHLVRMNDGAMHGPVKQAVSSTLASIDIAGARTTAAACAERLAHELEPVSHHERLADFAFQLPVHVVATLLGVAASRLPQTAVWVGEFVRCIAPGSTPEQIERGTSAAAHLREMFRARLPARASGGDALLGRLAVDVERANRAGVDVVVSNGIGLLSQAYEATAGLIGNTLVALAREREVRRQLEANPALVREIVAEVVRHDPPVQNTRRFVARSGDVAGVSMSEGDAVLVVLAAANRDPAANTHPERFDVHRPARRAFTFGTGAHACPGEALSTAIAAAGVERLLRSGVEPDALLDTLVYRASANTRIPLF
jgi:cytochrome P450